VVMIPVADARSPGIRPDSGREEQNRFLSGMILACRVPQVLDYAQVAQISSSHHPIGRAPYLRSRCGARRMYRSWPENQSKSHHKRPGTQVSILRPGKTRMTCPGTQQ
jgi:hypothetical protein